MLKLFRYQSLSDPLFQEQVPSIDKWNVDVLVPKPDKRPYLLDTSTYVEVPAFPIPSVDSWDYFTLPTFKERKLKPYEDIYEVKVPAIIPSVDSWDYFTLPTFKDKKFFVIPEPSHLDVFAPLINIWEEKVEGFYLKKKKHIVTDTYDFIFEDKLIDFYIQEFHIFIKKEGILYEVTHWDNLNIIPTIPEQKPRYVFKAKIRPFLLRPERREFIFNVSDRNFEIKPMTRRFLYIWKP